jgi:hypothetical protein
MLRHDLRDALTKFLGHFGDGVDVHVIASLDVLSLIRFGIAPVEQV